MRTNYCLTIGAFALLVSPATSLAGSPGGELAADVREEIATIPEVYVERALAGDWDGVSELYHQEAIQILPDAPPVEGRKQIRGALARMFGTEGGVRLTDFSVDIAETEVLGETVYVQATYRFDVERLGDPGASVEQHGLYMNILRQDADGVWRIWRQFVNRAHPPVGPAAK